MLIYSMGCNPRWRAYLENCPHNEGAQVGHQAIDALAVGALGCHHDNFGALCQKQLGGCLQGRSR